MAAEGIRFERFYSGAPVCSPTRGSCLTGRHPYRYGIWTANAGHMKPEEVTLPSCFANRVTLPATSEMAPRYADDRNERLQPRRSRRHRPLFAALDERIRLLFLYGKRRSNLEPDARSSGGVRPFVRFEGKRPGDPFGTRYWTGPDEFATDNLDGDDSRIIMDRAIPFIEGAVKDNKPFFAVIWFTPRILPAVGGGKYLEMYSEEEPDRRHYYACITAMDANSAAFATRCGGSAFMRTRCSGFAATTDPKEKTPPRRDGRPGSAAKTEPLRRGCPSTGHLDLAGTGKGAANRNGAVRDGRLLSDNCRCAGPRCIDDGIAAARRRQPFAAD